MNAKNWRYRIAVDTGGTFTDAVVVREDGQTALGKASTTLDVAWPGVKGAIAAAAEQFGVAVDEVIRSTDSLVFGTTRATNAILESKTARTAMITTRGFRDVLTFREGGKFGPFDMYQAYPKPYIPRRYTFEIDERVDSLGNVVVALDRDAVKSMLLPLFANGNFEAAAVCLMNSHVNGAHEAMVGQVLGEIAPDLPFTLSHELNPIIREYRRASGTALDASLKPLMQSYLGGLARDLSAFGFRGELLFANSQGGVTRFEETVQRPLNTVRSGPALAPVAGHALAAEAVGAGDVVVCDAGGTSFEVSIVRDGRVTTTRETWIGEQFTGHITGLASVDTRSIGSGGGSIATVDEGGLLRVGPRSAGAMPGPACYGQGGTEPTVTDAALCLGMLDAEYFLGGRQPLHVEKAQRALEGIAQALDYNVDQAAAAILAVQTENMKSAIRRMTIAEGMDPRKALLVAGGGSAGLNILQIAFELGCEKVLVPRTAAGLSALGGHVSDLVVEYSAAQFTTSKRFDTEAVQVALDTLQRSVDSLREQLEEHGYKEFRQELIVEARYAHQAWELEVPVGDVRSVTEDGVTARLATAFHEVHERVYDIVEPDHEVEFLNWRLRLISPRQDVDRRLVDTDESQSALTDRASRLVMLPGLDRQQIPVVGHRDLVGRRSVDGPAILEEPTTTLVIYPGWRVTDTGNDSYLAEWQGIGAP